ncbi:MAG TPA: pyridoxal-phosphate dependent enzyme [bacterium]|nr:pyridoxal-phosphate dependent enzyme [bacterium]
MVSAADVRAAAARIAPHLLRTPVLRSEGLGFALKLECRQVTGSFKARGALNKMLTMPPEERARGIVAASAGNHALGVAHACKVIGGGTRATVFVQGNASRAKIVKLSRYPVDVRLVGQTFEEAQAEAMKWAQETGATFVSAYDDPDVLAGQGTVGLEIAEDFPDADVVVVPTGGGALLGGIALAIREKHPRTRVVGVNPEASPSARESLAAGRALDPYHHGPTLALGLAGGFGKLGFEIAKEFVDEVVLVSEEEMARATAALIDAEQIIAEPSGIAAVAAILAEKVRGARAVAVISGGNIDAATLRDVLAAA